MSESGQRIDGSSIERLYERVSLVDGVPLLIFGQLSNLKEVQRCLQIITVIKLGAELDFFDCMKYREPEGSAYNKKRYSSNKYILYYMILGILSVKGEMAVKRHQDFKSVNKDPLELWKIVKSTHNRSKSRPGRDSKSAEPGELQILTNNCSRSSRDSGEPMVLKLEDRVCYQCGERGHLRASCIVSSEKSADDSAVGANINSYRRASEDTQRSGHPSKSENDHNDDNRTRANSDVRGRSASDSDRGSTRSDGWATGGVNVALLVKKALAKSGESRMSKTAIVLDTESAGSIFFNYKLLGKLRAAKDVEMTARVLCEEAEIASMGCFDGFFDVGVNISSRANYLSLAMVEAVHPVSYVKNKGYVVASKLYGDIVFAKCRVTGVYMSDTATWERKIAKPCHSIERGRMFGGC